jgi:hypothetical protein
VVENKWKKKMQQACQAKAQEVNIELQRQYESKLSMVRGAAFVLQKKYCFTKVNEYEFELRLTFRLR